MSEIYIENYSERSIVVLGDTKPHKDALKSMGGRFNSRLKDDKVGWVFPKTFEQQVKDYVSNGKITVKVKPNKDRLQQIIKMQQEIKEDIKRVEKKIDNLDKKLDVVVSLLHQIIGKPIESNNSGTNEKRRLLRRM